MSLPTAQTEFDIFSPLPERSKEKIKEEVEARQAEFSNKETNLQKWPVEVNGQNFAIVSFVGPDCSQKTQKAGFCVLGVFADKESAAAHVRKIMQHENNFDVYVCSMYEWCLCTPPRGTISTEHCEEKLNELISERKKHQELEKATFEERKRLLLEANAASVQMKKEQQKD